LELRSPRLVLRPLGIAQCDAALALWQQPGVRRYLWDDRIIDRDEALVPLRVSERDFGERRFGLWGLHLPGDAALLGFCGLRMAEVVPEPELLFALDDGCRGRGFAWEGARAVLQYAFDELGLPAVGAAADAGNVGSTRLLEALGLHLTRRGDLNGLDTLFYVCTIDDWASGVEA
jgi:ribosomal-protein-alanine N-acetyltransferase